MKEKFYTIVYMILVAAVFTAGVTYAKVKTQDRIRLNEEARHQSVVLRALRILKGNDLPASEVSELFSRRVTERTVDGLTVYSGYADDARRDFIGYAFRVGGLGLWSRIDGILALDENLETIVGITFGKQGETPGLGGRITEEWFTDQFVGKSVEQSDAAGNYIYFVAEQKELLGPNEVHGITGATQTTDGVAKFLNADIARIKKLMAAQEQGN